MALQEKEAIQEFIRIESGTEGLRDAMGVFERTLGLYENWITSHATRTAEKEVMERQQFATSLDSQYSQAHYAFGKIYSETGLLPRAEEAFRQSLIIDPTFVDAHRELSAILIRQGRFEEAVVPALAYAQAITDDWVAYQNLAVIYQELNQLDKRDAAEHLALQVSTGEDHRSLITFFERLKEEKATG
jgi:tetratricopeptide (TPR) repeat protein